MRTRSRWIVLSVLCAAALPVTAAEPEASADGLTPVGAFANITDRSERSRALFKEAGKVFQGRRPAPGTQSQFGELLDAWIETGAVCPTS
jgi:hypothetical protein